MKNEYLNLYSPPEAAEYCGVAIQTLNRWRKAGHVAPSGTIEVGRGHLYTESALIGALQTTNYDRRNLNVEHIPSQEYVMQAWRYEGYGK
tara:strand:- start:54 stop:323 length:270 start_codon:yes stop_codon:yes gene_type:complete